MDKLQIETCIDSTVQHYKMNAESFWEGTKDHDVDQNYAAFQQNLPSTRGMTVLDLGCGPGRDLKYFKSRGHRAIGIDACEDFCEMAREFSSCEVWQQNFCEMDLPENYFDGIFANASLFHVPAVYLKRVLCELNACLKKNGILFSSNPRGSGEYFDGSRYGNYMELDVYEKYLQSSGFEILDHYYRPPGWPREEQTWLAVVCRKVKSN